MWRKSARLLGFALLVAVLGMGGVEFASAWSTRHVLAGAARKAAQTAVSVPLNAKNCRDITPCSIEDAAAAAKGYLTRVGFKRASCIQPKSPSFSGVLVWVFSCDGSSTCSTMDSVVCVSVDMTPVTIQRNGTLIPFTRVTVQFPHKWAVDSLLRSLPGRPALLLPKSVSASALVRD